MAGYGGFAGGLADGLRNGMQMNYMQERMDDAARARTKDEMEDAAALATARLAGPGVGLDALVQPAPSSPGMPAASADSAGATPTGVANGLREIAAGQPAVTTPAAKIGLQPAPNPLDAVRQINERYGKEYRGLLDAGNGRGAAALAVQREKLIAPLREKAFGSAMTDFTTTRDPKGLVQYANNFGHLSFQLTDIMPVDPEPGSSELEGPFYKISGVRPDGAEFAERVSKRDFDGMLAQAADPGYHQRAFVEQMKADRDYAEGRRKALSDATIKTDAAVDQETRLLPVEEQKAGIKTKADIATFAGKAPIERETDRLRIGQQTAGQIQVAGVNNSARVAAAEASAAAGQGGFFAPQPSSAGYFITGKDGKPQFLQGPGGTPILPPGVDPGVQGNVAAARAQGGVQGKDAGEAVATAGNTDATFGNILSTIDAAVKHPGLEASTGLRGKLPTIPGTDAAGFMAYHEQMAGQAFLQAFDSLKGGGVITDVEGQKATQAIARLDRAQSSADYKKALGELRGVVASARSRAQQKAARGSAQPGAGASSDTPAPAPAQQRTVTRTGRDASGRTVRQYSDGSISYVD